MFKFHLLKRGRSLLIAASMMLSIVPLVGPLAFGNIRAASATATSGNPKIYMPVVAANGDMVAETRRWKRTPTPTATNTRPAPTSTKTSTPLPPTPTNTKAATLVPPTPTMTKSATPLTPTATKTSSPTALPPTSTPNSQPMPIGVPGSWRMVFSDEFNGSALDSSRWTPGWFGTGITGPVNSSETACYDSSQVTVPGDGSLHIALSSKSVTCGGTSRPYAGGLISSNGKFQYTYGYFEVRAYLPAASTGAIANWPATWNDGQSWPADGENDTMEGLGGQACYHFHSPSGGPGACASGNYSGWHTFGSDWQAGSVTYYYDGVKVGQITTGITSSPHYLILDYTQGGYGGPTVVPALMLVDYARVWQH